MCELLFLYYCTEESMHLLLDAGHISLLPLKACSSLNSVDVLPLSCYTVLFGRKKLYG